ncbi:MAG TPA: glycosyltransferase family 2 protein [Pyrinomonadaceae bacterium]|nr:glycosyltransferase family 2 protein [Pyrinomonadaceae bacterium]
MTLRITAEIFFWLSAAALVYTYAGYPALIALISWLRPRKVAQADITPSLTIIITAYNEERALADKLENTLALDYPRELVEIIVASDCSGDRTDEIVQSFHQRGVILHRQPERLGKTAAQNAAVAKSRGEIIVFSDATSLYQPDALRMIVRSFADSTVGCVGGRLIYVDPSNTDVGRGARRYWGYETFLKHHESRACSLIGVSGCLYAVRKSAYVPLYHEACSDFIIATKMVEQGLRAIYEPEASCSEETNQRPDNELRMRVRVIAQTLTDLWRHRAMLNPLRSGLYGVELLSHKLMRYFVPLFLIVLFATSAALASNSANFRTLFLAQSVGYLGGAISWLLESSGVRSRVLALPHYFVLANVASVIAMFQFLRGERYARWEPIRDQSVRSVSEGYVRKNALP